MPKNKKEKVFFFVTLTLGALAHYYYLFYWISPEVTIPTIGDVQGMITFGEHLARFGFKLFGYESDKPPAYYLLIALSIKLSEYGLFSTPHKFLQILQFICSVAIPVVMYQATKRWLGSRLALGLFAFAMIYLPFTAYAGIYLPNIFFIFFTALLFCLMVTAPFPWRPSRAACIGLTWACGNLFKSYTSLFAPFLLLYIAYQIVRLFKRGNELQSIRRHLRTAFSFSLAVFTVVSFQILYLAALYHQPHSMSRNAPVMFALGKCTECGGFDDQQGSKWWTPNAKSGKKCLERPFFESDYYWKRGFRCLAEHPSRVFDSIIGVSSLYVGNVAFPFLGMPSITDWNRRFELLYALVFLPGTLLALLRLRIFRRPRRLFVSSFLLYALYVVTIILRGELAYRVCIDGACMPLAIWGWLSYSKVMGAIFPATKARQKNAQQVATTI